MVLSCRVWSLLLHQWCHWLLLVGNLELVDSLLQLLLLLHLLQVLQLALMQQLLQSLDLQVALIKLARCSRAVLTRAISLREMTVVRIVEIHVGFLIVLL